MTEIIEREMTSEEIAEQKAAIAALPAELKAQATEQRRQGYQTISDPVFFQWQRGEKTEQDWADARAEVEALYPIPEA